MFGAVAALAVALWSSSSSADPYDFRIYQLGNPANGAARYDPEANGNFRVFAREFAAALTSVNLTPPETLGHAAGSTQPWVMAYGEVLKEVIAFCELGGIPLEVIP